jgi:5S rRNA maturation endonuclease (ribonuclease M5)
MLSSGRKAIAIPSATLMKDDDVTTITRHLTPHTRLHMFPDHDEPGERLFLQLKSRLPDLQHHHLPLGCKDFAEYYVLTKKKGVSS